MLDVLVLEDNEMNIELIQDMFEDSPGPKMTYRIVSTSEEFLEVISAGPARLYFMDNEVPEQSNSFPHASFIDNHTALIKHHPDARVYCISNALDFVVKEYLTHHQIEHIEKYAVYRTAKQQLSV